jgi:predicted O-methyltransferase YrrM
MEDQLDKRLSKLLSLNNKIAFIEELTMSSLHEWTPPTLSAINSLCESDDLLSSALELAKKSGYWLEFGAGSGSTLTKIADFVKNDKSKPLVFGFDSFDGLPEDWACGYKKGHWKQNYIPSISGAEIVVGYFDKVLPDWIRSQEKLEITFVHIDCDLYSSTKYVLSQIAPYLSSGAIIVFDEIINYPGFERHEFRALYECVIEDILFDYEFLFRSKSIGGKQDNAKLAIRVTPVNKIIAQNLKNCLSSRCINLTYTYFQLLDTVIKDADPNGLWLEFGVQTGGSLRKIVAAANEKKPRPHVAGFDGFNGLPEAWRPGFEKGVLSCHGIVPDVPGAEIVVGWFNETLIKWLAKQSSPQISFVHIDCDIYSSTKYVLSNIAPFLINGAIIIFDELIAYPTWEDHEWKALYECVSENLFKFEFFAHCRGDNGQPKYQVAIKIIK